MRVLSAAVHELGRAHAELEHAKNALEESERERRKRGERLVQELKGPTEREIAKRVLQSLFTDDDEEAHKVERRQSRLVRLCDTRLGAHAHFVHSPSPLRNL